MAKKQTKRQVTEEPPVTAYVSAANSIRSMFPPPSFFSSRDREMMETRRRFALECAVAVTTHCVGVGNRQDAGHDVVDMAKVFLAWLEGEPMAYAPPTED